MHADVSVRNQGYESYARTTRRLVLPSHRLKHRAHRCAHITRGFESVFNSSTTAQMIPGVTMADWIVNPPQQQYPTWKQRSLLLSRSSIPPVVPTQVSDVSFSTQIPFTSHQGLSVHKCAGKHCLDYWFLSCSSGTAVEQLSLCVKGTDAFYGNLCHEQTQCLSDTIWWHAIVIVNTVTAGYTLRYQHTKYGRDMAYYLAWKEIYLSYHTCDLLHQYKFQYLQPTQNEIFSTTITAWENQEEEEVWSLDIAPCLNPPLSIPLPIPSIHISSSAESGAANTEHHPPPPWMVRQFLAQGWRQCCRQRLSYAAYVPTWQMIHEMDASPGQSSYGLWAGSAEMP